MKGVTLRLRALSGSPLSDPETDAYVARSAHDIAKESGVTIVSLETTDSMLIATIEADGVIVVAFLAELRRRTNTWYENKYRDGPLWGTSRSQT